MSYNVEIDQLTLYVEGSLEEDGNIYVTAASLFSLFTLQCCKDFKTSLVFVKKPCTCKTILSLDYHSKSCNNLIFRINSSQLKSRHKFILLSECPIMMKNCYFPLIHEVLQNYCIIGLCSSLRYILISYSKESPDGIYAQLLGFRKSCLQACAESSVWTKFCEIDSVETLTEYYVTNFEDNSKEFEIPAIIVRFDNHLKHPPILHNALKQKQDSLQKVSSPAQYSELKKKKLIDLPNLEHKFAEGVDITLADILLYASFSLIIHKISNRNDLEEVCPLVLKWLSFMDTTQCIIVGKCLLKYVKEDFLPISSNLVSSFLLPTVPFESLYKSDPQRYKPRWRSFTHQKDIEDIFQKLSKFAITNSHDAIINDQNNSHLKEDSDVLQVLKYLSISMCNSLNLIVSNLKFKPDFNWDSFPSAVHPIEGQLPTNRIKRKLQQLESIAQIVIDIAQNNDVIVDFCAGGGHLGILLAYCLPRCKILLVENKKNSLDKAKSRVQTLNLTNVYFYQCNLDYFDVSFDIGVCLHACGVATDLIMLKCVNQEAAFVCCPCCYGSIKPNHILNYPRSTQFSNIYEISIPEYLILAHAADQTHSIENPKTMQGKKCMELVDYDRLSFAETLGYNTALTTMNPPDCSPKNHILIGMRPNKK